MPTRSTPGWRAPTSRWHSGSSSRRSSRTSSWASATSTAGSCATRSPATCYEAAINAHTEEDETHSALFLEDWRELGLDAQLGWGVEDTMAWYYTAPETEVFRRYAMRLTRMCVETPDPLVRFGMMEAVETCGHVFFGHTAPLAAELSRRTGAALRYFGPYHLARETGIVDRRRRPLRDRRRSPPEQRRRALALVEEVFAMFTVKNDHLLAYASGDHGGGGGAPARPGGRGRGRARREVRPLHAVEQRHRRPDGRAARRAEGGAGRAPVPGLARGARRRPGRAAARLRAAVDPGHHGLRRPHDVRAGLPGAARRGRAGAQPARRPARLPPPAVPRRRRRVGSRRRARLGRGGDPALPRPQHGHRAPAAAAWRRSSTSPSGTAAPWCATG